MQHLALGVAHVALKLGEQRDGSCHGHVLKHILLPVLTHCDCVLRQSGGKIALNDAPLARIGHHGHYARAEAVYGIIEPSALSRAGSKHHLIGSLKVFLVHDVHHIAVFSVCHAHNLGLQLLREVI